jgi:hypothetical protein
VRADGTIVGLTRDGARLIEILVLDDEEVNQWRRRVLTILRRIERVLRPPWWRRMLNWARRLFRLSVSAPAVPPDVAAELREWFGFPNDLPDLFALQPPGGNSRPAGLAGSSHLLQLQGQLPELY